MSRTQRATKVKSCGIFSGIFFSLTNEACQLAAVYVSMAGSHWTRAHATAPRVCTLVPFHWFKKLIWHVYNTESVLSSHWSMTGGATPPATRGTPLRGLLNWLPVRLVICHSAHSNLPLGVKRIIAVVTYTQKWNACATASSAMLWQRCWAIARVHSGVYVRGCRRCSSTPPPARVGFMNTAAQ